MNDTAAPSLHPDPGEVVDLQMRKFQKELSSGTVSLALLSVLGAATEPMYGYQIAKTLERHGEGALSGKQSALYPVLRNLEAAGMLESFVEPSISGPPRRYYAITAPGRDVLAAWTAAWTATRDSLDSVLKGDLS
ncbi:MAG: PadR family transcriptional regulator [Lysobacter sp.]|nr:PadR family transcriptional regulator [Lysobacter sp.]